MLFGFSTAFGGFRIFYEFLKISSVHAENFHRYNVHNLGYVIWKQPFMGFFHFCEWNKMVVLRVLLFECICPRFLIWESLDLHMHRPGHSFRDLRAIFPEALLSSLLKRRLKTFQSNESKLCSLARQKKNAMFCQIYALREFLTRIEMKRHFFVFSESQLKFFCRFLLVCKWGWRFLGRFCLFCISDNNCMDQTFVMFTVRDKETFSARLESTLRGSLTKVELLKGLHTDLLKSPVKFDPSTSSLCGIGHCFCRDSYVDNYVIICFKLQAGWERRNGAFR